MPWKQLQSCRQPPSSLLRGTLANPPGALACEPATGALSPSAGMWLPWATICAHVLQVMVRSETG